jgi:hypothetical protein
MPKKSTHQNATASHKLTFLQERKKGKQERVWEREIKKEEQERGKEIIGKSTGCPYILFSWLNLTFTNFSFQFYSPPNLSRAILT